ncbi:glycosyltransferase [Crocinitomicaceae bacterium]|nr:glycosyltransferase [Crocinitomicaceae bacterium]MDC1244550.1 glycosyltransferase [Crocinitomicaceae bacterium]
MLGFSILIILYLIFYIVLIIGWRNTHNPTPSKVGSNIKPSELTVVVPFRNECDNLSILLNNINRLKILPSKFIFVNDHSEDNWSELFEKKNHDLIKVYSLNESSYGKKIAIQEGVKHADTKYILSWDADIQFEDNYFADVQKLEVADLIILPVHFESNNIIQSLGEIDFYLANFVNQASAYWQRPIMCNGANLLFEKNAYLESINLNAHAHILSGDDMFLLRHMIKQNKKVYCASNQLCRITTQSPSSFLGYISQRTRWFGKSLLIKDGLLNFWAIVQFIFTVSFFSFFIYWILEDPKTFGIIFLIKCGIDLSFLSVYFFSIKKNTLTLLIPFYGLLFPIYNLFILFSFYFRKQKWKGRKLYQ